MRVPSLERVNKKPIAFSKKPSQKSEPQSVKLFILVDIIKTHGSWV